MEPLLYQCSDPPGRQSREPCRQIPPGEGYSRQEYIDELKRMNGLKSEQSLRRISGRSYISRNNLQIAYRSGIGYNKICFIIYPVLSEEEPMPHANIIYVTNLQLPELELYSRFSGKPAVSLF